MTDQPYTPSTEEVRNQYSRYGRSVYVPEAAVAFDRWLAVHDAEVRDEAVRARNHAMRQRDEEAKAKRGNIEALNAALTERDAAVARAEAAEEERDDLATQLAKVREWVRAMYPYPQAPTVQDAWIVAELDHLDNIIAPESADILRERDAEKWNEMAERGEATVEWDVREDGAYMRTVTEWKKV